jgi:thiol-disulfide isomerase/thioredoxin
MRKPGPLKRQLKRYSGLTLNILFFAAVFFGVSAFQSRNMLSAAGAAAPQLRGPLLHAGSYDLATTARDRPVLIYFFAPWCKICGASADNLARLRRMRDEEALEILAVVLDWQNLAEVEAYVEKHELGLPVLLGDAQIAREWRIQAFPTYYVLDAKHRIQRRDLGYSTQLGLWLRTWFFY